MKARPGVGRGGVVDEDAAVTFGTIMSTKKEFCRSPFTRRQPIRNDLGELLAVDLFLDSVDSYPNARGGYIFPGENMTKKNMEVVGGEFVVTRCLRNHYGTEVLLTYVHGCGAYGFCLRGYLFDRRFSERGG